MNQFQRRGFRSVQSLICGIIILAITRLGGGGVAMAQDTSPGSLDALNALLAGPTIAVYSTVVQPDGKLILAGQFTSVLGTPRTNIARLNADGTLDTTFNPNANNLVYSLSVQADGRILLGGQFTTLQPNGAATATARNRIARLNTDGTLDTTFNPNANDIVYSLGIQADGRILLGGLFTTLQPNGAATATGRNRVARLHADGTLDTLFNPNADRGVRALAVQADGRILLGGEFTTFQPNGAVSATARNRIARLQADGTLDTIFNPNANNVVAALAVQADGRILLGGEFTALQPNGAASATARNRIARLQADGTLDTIFNPNANNYVYSIGVQTDGKVLVAGFISALQPNGAGTPITRNSIARLNADGTLDPGFDPNAKNHAYSIALQADGKVLLGGLFGTLQPNGAATATARARFARLNNGTATQSLTIPNASQVLWTRGGAAPEVSQVTVELSTTGGSTWTPLGNAARVGTSANWQITGLSLPGSGQIRVRGRTTGGYGNGSAGLVQAVVPFSLLDIAVEHPAGTSLADGTGSIAFGTVTLGSRALVKTVTIRNVGSGSLTLGPITRDGAHAADFTIGPLATTILAPGGTTSFDVSFAPGASGIRSAAIHIASTVNGAKNPFDLTLAGTGFLDTTPGSVDGLDAPLGGLEPIIYATAVQPDGKVILVGRFDTVLGVAHSELARLNADGTLDTTFNPNPKYRVHCVAVQADGKILIGGLFTTLQPHGTATATTRNRIARLNADGTLDTTFNPNANEAVLSLATQADGKILIGGWFTTLQPNGAATATTRRHVARLNADGTLDTTFNPNANDAVLSLATQDDGKILIGGEFTTLQPNGGTTATTRNHIARLNADGTLDTTFNPNANRSVESMAVQADGKILIGGPFTTLQPNGATTATTRNHIARLNADGAPDTTFNPNANSWVECVAVQADGKILIGGEFTTLQPNGAATATTRNHIARLNADGTLDMTFNPNVGGGLNSFFVFSNGRFLNTGGSVNSLAVQADGRILIGGGFRTLQPNGAATPTDRIGFARLNNDAATQSFTVPTTAQVVWNRGGSAPEVSQVTFELSVNGGASWTPLGTGTRVGTTANWQRTGLALPNIGRIRARGRTTGGSMNGSSGLVEFVASFSLASSITMELPDGTPLADGTGTVNFETLTLGSLGSGTIITIRNPGPGTLTLGGIIKDGFHPADFYVGAPASMTVPPGGTTTFPVSFRPEAAGIRSVAIKVTSNVTDAKNPYDLTLIGTGLLDTSPGSVDGFQALVSGAASTVYATAVQPDGKVILAGEFTSVLGVARYNIARLNADGTLDTTFNPNANGSVRTVAVQADGRILIGGRFSSLQPNGAATATTRQYVARLNADGTLDTTFNPKANQWVHCVAVQADGKLLLGGEFITLQPNGAATSTTRKYIARLNADGTLDASFNPNANGAVHSLEIQADGRILIGGMFSSLQPPGVIFAATRNRIARLQANGTVDLSFNPNANDAVLSLATQADGKILLGGKFSLLQPNGAATATTRNRIARLNADGTLDTTFNPNANDAVLSLATQVDGKILLGGEFSLLQPNGAATATTRNRIARLKADGTLDATFNPNANDAVLSVATQDDGKILLGGKFSLVQPTGAATATQRKGFARLNNDAATQSLSIPSVSQAVWFRTGSAPEVSQVTFELSANGGTTWNPLGQGTRVGTTPNWQLTGLNLLGSGQIRARGRTDGGHNNGSAGLVESVASFNWVPAITVEQPPGTSLVDGTGSIAFGTVTLGSSGLTKTVTIRNTGTSSLNLGAITKDGLHGADFTVGALGSTTVAPGGTTTFPVSFTPGAAGARSAAIHIASNVNGTQNPFDLALTGTGFLDAAPGSVEGLNALVSGPGASVYTMAVQPDGKVVLGGWFHSVLGVPRTNIARLNANGTLDTTFNPNANAGVFSVAVQTDGKVLIGGLFTTLRPNGAATATMRNYMARLNADGTLDTAFNPNANYQVDCMAVQANGKILIGGVFDALQPNGAATATIRNHIARLNADGTLDTTFNPNANNYVSSVAVQADGKILLGGGFTTLQPNGAATPTTRSCIARLNGDGTLDTPFNPNASGSVRTVVLQADGRILIGGGFTTLQPNGAATATIRNRIARLNADGTLDTTFNPNANFWIFSAVVQADGKILIGGAFTTLQPNGAATATTRNRVARLNADGTLDTAFNPNANDVVLCVVMQADGKILLGGFFTSLQPNGAATPTMRNGFARLNNGAATQSLAATSSAQVLWSRSGSAPEISQVTLDLSLNGGATWTPLGQGTRVGTTANWQLTGLSLPTSGQIRARGRTTGGCNNGSAGLVESVASFSGIAPATLPPSHALRVVRIAQEDGTLRMEFEAQPTAGLVEVWRAETVDADTWTRLDGSTLRPTTAGHLELRIPADPDLPQQFYRFEIHSEPVTSDQPR